MTLAGSSVAVLGTLRDHPVFAGQALRFGLAAVLLHLLVRRFGPPGPAPRLTPAQWLRVLVLAGFGMVGFNVAATAAGHHTDPAFVGVVVGTAPLVVGVLTPLLARARPSGRVVVAGLLVAAGVAAAHGLGRRPAGLVWRSRSWRSPPRSSSRWSRPRWWRRWGRSGSPRTPARPPCRSASPGWWPPGRTCCRRPGSWRRWCGWGRWRRPSRTCCGSPRWTSSAPNGPCCSAGWCR